MPELPWVGRHVRVNVDRTVEWVRCAYCNRPLRDATSRARGVGPDCLRDQAPEVIDQARDDARAADRWRWRLGQPATADPARVGLIPRESERAYVPGRPSTPEDEARWLKLKLALRDREHAVMARGRSRD